MYRLYTCFIGLASSTHLRACQHNPSVFQPAWAGTGHVAHIWTRCLSITCHVEVCVFTRVPHSHLWAITGYVTSFSTLLTWLLIPGVMPGRPMRIPVDAHEPMCFTHVAQRGDLPMCFQLVTLLPVQHLVSGRCTCSISQFTGSEVKVTQLDRHDCSSDTYVGLVITHCLEVCQLYARRSQVTVYVVFHVLFAHVLGYTIVTGAGLSRITCV